MNNENQSEMQQSSAATASGAEFAEQHREILEDLFEDGFLNVCYRQIKNGEVAQGMNSLVEGLDDRRLTSSDKEWDNFKQLCLMNPIRQLVHQDPFTRHAFEQQKLHKYAGDPTLLDFIHAPDDQDCAPEGTSEVGAAIFQLTRHAPACRGVRSRTQYIARMIDELAACRDAPKILSLGIGYLDEASQCQAMREKRLGRWLAIDSEPENVAEILKRYGEYAIEAQCSTVQGIIDNVEHPEEFDLIFSTGLYDYLEQPLGQRLAVKLFEMLQSGGQLVIANFPEEMAGLGYMQCFMDLHPVCRSRSQMMGLVAEIAADQIREAVLLDESSDEILLLKVTKN